MVQDDPSTPSTGVQVEVDPFFNDDPTGSDLGSVKISSPKVSDLDDTDDGKPPKPIMGAIIALSKDSW